MSRGSQRNPRKVTKVIIHYLDSPSYTYKNVYVDCFVDWVDMEVNLIDVGDYDLEPTLKVNLTEDTLAVEIVDEEGGSYWINPEYHASVKVDITTAKQRAKKNNPEYQRIKGLKWLTSMANQYFKTKEEMRSEVKGEEIRFDQ